jgi:hypothetical protein
MISQKSFERENDMSDQLAGLQNLAEIPSDVKDFLIKTCSVLNKALSKK